MTDRRLSSRRAAEHVGLPYATWRAYVARGTAPKPDGHDDGFDMDYWLESKLDEWQARRPGHGGRPKKVLEQVDEALDHPETFMERRRPSRDKRVSPS